MEKKEETPKADVTKKRVGVYMLFSWDEKLEEMAKEESKKKEKFISKNKLILAAVEQLFKGNVNI